MKVSKEKVDNVIKDRIEPILSVDGGTIEVVQVNETQRSVRVRFSGSYYGSPCRSYVFKYVVEPVLKEAFADLRNVEWVD